LQQCATDCVQQGECLGTFDARCYSHSDVLRSSAKIFGHDGEDLSLAL
jgi:hypothetical protein